MLAGDASVRAVPMRSVRSPRGSMATGLMGRGGEEGAELGSMNGEGVGGRDGVGEEEAEEAGEVLVVDIFVGEDGD